MKSSSLFILLSILCPFALAQSGNDRQLIEETVALARAYLGGDAKLDAIKSIEYRGSLVYGDGSSGSIESVVVRPHFQQFSSVINGYKETTTLNRTEAWRKVERIDQPGSWSMDFLDPDGIRHMVASVQDTLSFFKEPPSRNGRIEYLGTEELDGRQVRVLKYLNSDYIWFLRYIDAETGKVLRMANDKGTVFTEQGEILVDGVRFPEKLIVTFATGAGQKSSMELSYTSVVVNGEIDFERFKVPVMAR